LPDPDVIPNGQDMNASEADAAVQTLALAAGEIDQAEYAVWLKASCQKRKRP